MKLTLATILLVCLTATTLVKGQQQQFVLTPVNNGQPQQPQQQFVQAVPVPINNGQQFPQQQNPQPILIQNPQNPGFVQQPQFVASAPALQLPGQQGFVNQAGLVPSTFVQPGSYSYNLTVFLSAARKFEDTAEGKLKILVKGLNTNQKVTLSTSAEKLSRGLVKSYLVASPLSIGQIEKIQLRWTKKSGISAIFSSPKVYVDSIVIDPQYIQDFNVRRASTTRLCSNKRPEGIKHNEEADFYIRC